MSARSLSYARPVPHPADEVRFPVRVADLRELAAGVAYLLAVAEHNDASDPGDEPDDLAFLRSADQRLAALLHAAVNQ